MAIYTVAQHGPGNFSPTDDSRRVIGICGEVAGQRLVVTGRKHSVNSTFGGRADYYRLMAVDADCSSGIPGDKELRLIHQGVEGVGTEEIRVEVPLPDPLDKPIIWSYWITREAKGLPGFNPLDPAHRHWFWGGVVLLKVSPE